MCRLIIADKAGQEESRTPHRRELHGVKGCGREGPVRSAGQRPHAAHGERLELPHDVRIRGHGESVPKPRGANHGSCIAQFVIVCLRKAKSMAVVCLLGPTEPGGQEPSYPQRGHPHVQAQHQAPTDASDGDMNSVRFGKEQRHGADAVLLHAAGGRLFLVCWCFDICQVQLTRRSNHRAALEKFGAPGAARTLSKRNCSCQAFCSFAAMCCRTYTSR